MLKPISNPIRNLRAISYIIKETLPSLLLGVIVFIAILLMFQMLKLTELLLIHGITASTIFQLVVYLSISFLPAILPMSVLFSVLMTYGRLSSDSEIIAFKSLGLSQKTLTIPAICIGILMTLISLQTYFFIGPWGESQYNKMVNQFTGAGVVSTIREGTFAEGFYDMVVYSNHVDDKKGILKDVFIYDERSEVLPITIIAQEGQVLTQKDKEQGTVLRLFNGSIHRSGQGVYTKIQFENYDIFLRPEMAPTSKEKKADAMTIRELYVKLHSIQDPIQQKELLLTLQAELHKRWALPFACLIFSLIGVGLGTVVNKRVARSGGFVLSIGLIVAYWTLYIAMNGMVQSATIPAYIGLWLPNFIFSFLAFYTLRLIWYR